MNYNYKATYGYKVMDSSFVMPPQKMMLMPVWSVIKKGNIRLAFKFIRFNFKFRKIIDWTNWKKDLI